MSAACTAAMAAIIAEEEHRRYMKSTDNETIGDITPSEFMVYLSVGVGLGVIIALIANFI